MITLLSLDPLLIMIFIMVIDFILHIDFIVKKQNSDQRKTSQNNSVNFI